MSTSFSLLSTQSNHLGECTLPSDSKILCTAVERQHQKVLAACDSKGVIHFWNFRASAQLMSGSGQQQSQPTALTFLSQGSLMVGSSKGILSLWNTEKPKTQPAVWKGHSTSLNAMVCIAGERIATAADSVIKLWDVRTRGCIVELKHHTGKVTTMDVSQQCSVLASGSEDTTVKLWDLRYPEKYLSTIENHADEVRCIRFHPHLRLMATGGIDKTAKLSRATGKTYCYTATTPTNESAVQAVDFTADGKKLLSVSSNRLKVWTVNDGSNKLSGSQDIILPAKGFHSLNVLNQQVMAVSIHQASISVWGYDLQLLPKNENQQPFLPRIASTKLIEPETEKHRRKSASKREAATSYKAIRSENKLDDEESTKPLAANYNEKRPNIPSLKKIDDEQPEKENCYRHQPGAKGQPPTPARNPRNPHLKLEKLKQLRFEEELVVRPIQRPAGNFDLLSEEVLDETIKASTFMGDFEQRKRYLQYDLIADMLQDNRKFCDIMQARTKKLYGMLQWWEVANWKSFTNDLQQADVGVSMDVIKTVLAVEKYRKVISEEAALGLLRKSAELLGSKHPAVVGSGLEFIIKMAGLTLGHDGCRSTAVTLELKKISEMEVLKQILHGKTQEQTQIQTVLRDRAEKVIGCVLPHPSP